MTETTGLQVLGKTIDPNTVESTDQTTQQTASYLESLVGEGKKYSSVEELAKAYVNADSHIKTIQAENKTLSDYNARLDEVVNKLNSITPASEPTIVSEPEINIDTLKETIRQEALVAFQQKTLAEQAEANKIKAYEKLKEVYGSEAAADAALVSLLKSDPDNKMVIDSLGSKNPDALVNFVTSQKPVSSKAPVDPVGVSSGKRVDTTGGLVSWASAKEVLRTDPKRYHSKEYQAAVRRSAEFAASQGQNYYN